MGDWFGGVRQVGTAAPAPNPGCLWRIEAGEARFDPDYAVDLLGAAGARALYGAYAMADRKLLVNMLPKAPPVTPAGLAVDPQAYRGRLAFTYAVLDLEALALTPPAGLAPAGAGNRTPLVLEGVNYRQVYPKGQPTAEDPGAEPFAIRPDGTAQKVLEAGTTGDFERIGRLR